MRRTEREDYRAAILDLDIRSAHGARSAKLWDRFPRWNKRKKLSKGGGDFMSNLKALSKIGKF